VQWKASSEILVWESYEPGHIRSADGPTAAFVGFTAELKYLGSIIDSSLTSDEDVDMRIKAATSALSALKTSI
jgi:hypothetical protein